VPGSAFSLLRPVQCEDPVRVREDGNEVSPAQRRIVGSGAAEQQDRAAMVTRSNDVQSALGAIHEPVVPRVHDICHAKDLIVDTTA
jgi:hypothetical protein